ncbi:putative sphingoid long-chain base transporter RSB1 [Rosellinia necatrix]|uniref:Putative sphingoid long-chain base transporter RSB1 n=1 Tax=Rosellinia necatrix TaxID=77044 RepID=A0A1S8A9A1_ROSNE|nr:putative sphingoid long-chain base transporter RSB1 [Rosellinia necatrix]
MAKEAPCTIETCDVSQSWYGYQPNLGINVFFVVVYSILAVYCLIVAVWKRSWLTYTISILIGSLLELVGYMARIAGYSDPWFSPGWILQYSIITFAPVLMSAALYVCIGRIADFLGRGTFNIRPTLYSRVFIPCDAIALVVQGAGGAVSVTESVTTKGVTPGAAIVIAGLTFQLLSLSIFFVLFGAVLWPSNIWHPKLSALPIRQAKRLRLFAICIITAIILIIGRSAFRVAELSEGIRGALIHDELLFIIFDGLPVLIATLIIVTAHPIFMLQLDQDYMCGKPNSYGMALLSGTTA